MAAAGLTVEQASRNADFQRDKAWKETQKSEKDKQKDINMAKSGFGVEQASRNSDFQRDKAYKEEQRNQKEEKRDL